MLLSSLCLQIAFAINDVDSINNGTRAVESKPAATRELGKSTGLALPRFVIFKSSETNWRNGPGSRYPIKWVYNERGYPVQIIAEFDNWRKVRDRDGEDGWVHEALISGNRNAVIIDNIILGDGKKPAVRDNELIIFRKPDEKSYPIARVEFGVIGKIKQCKLEWCRLEIGGHKGWVRKQNLWGVMPDEIIN